METQHMKRLKPGAEEMEGSQSSLSVTSSVQEEEEEEKKEGGS